MELRVSGPPGNDHGSSSVVYEEPYAGLSEEEFAKLANSMMIVIPHRPSSGLQGQTALSFGPWFQNGTYVAAPADEFGGFVEMTRAGLCRLFLDFCRDHPQVDKLVMIDADEVMSPNVPYKLAAWNKPIVSGVVCSATPARGLFCNFSVKDDSGVPRFPSYFRTKKLPARGLKRVHDVGTGLICIQRRVIEAILDAGEIPFMIPEAIRRASFEAGSLKWSEDIAFCRQCDKLGFDRWVDFSVHALHYKMMGVAWPDKAIDHELSAEEWKVDSRDYHHGG